jgi:tRNA dimethylallyltransferase
MLEGSMDLDQAFDNICSETSRFAKRQMTWLRAQKDIHWLDLPSDTAAEDIIYLLKSAVQRA